MIKSALLMLLFSCSLALADSNVLGLGAQWSWVNIPSQLASNCWAPNKGGFSCAYFPHGGKIYDIQYQSSVKVDNHEVLYRLILSHDGVSEFNNDAKILINTHHVSKLQATMIPVTLDLSQPVIIPAGWYVWIRARGAGSSHPAGAEVQVSIYGEWPSVEIIKP